jgi:redox-sensitive bicupin YhaK (pirin superfamily)
MNSGRKISKILKSKPTLEGAGVHLKRAFGYNEVPLLDPFLLFDDFHSDNPKDYIAGFPWHPHRGIETITYIIHGEMEHGDSLGNSGVIKSGDCQWMTAGSGIIHQEMPRQKERLLWGFQLWANLPKSQKMMDPRYRDITKDQIPDITIDNVNIKIISGEINGIKGPVKDIVTDPEYLDITIPSYSKFIHSVKDTHIVFAYIINGEGIFEKNQQKLIGLENLVIFSEGDELNIETKEKSVRFLLISGKPIGEPIAWQGPIVMTTQEELRLAFEEYRNRTFIKHR